MEQYLWVLKSSELDLIRELEPERLAPLDEDALLAAGSDKARARAYVFEEALSSVSTRLAEVAHEAAEALRDERLERARAGRGTGPETSGTADDGVGGGRARSHAKTTGGVKRDASSRSQGAARQPKRDAR